VPESVNVNGCYQPVAAIQKDKQNRINIGAMLTLKLTAHRPKSKRPSTEGLFVLHAATRGRQRMQGLAVTLAGVLLAASCNTTFQADALTAACGGQGVARQGLGCGSGFAVGFGKDFVAHVAILLRLV